MIAGFFGGPNAAMLAALGAFLGHLFPVWLKFRGGKGVATYIGVLLGLFWPAALVFCVVWLRSPLSPATRRCRRWSQAWLRRSSCGRSASPRWPRCSRVLTLLMFYKHRENISRLLAGTEGKIGQKA